MTHVFAKLSYEVFCNPSFFRQFKDFIGYFQIEQSIEESHQDCFTLWFWTDKVEIKEGEIRQVDIIVTRNNQNLLYFEIKKV